MAGNKRDFRLGDASETRPPHYPTLERFDALERRSFLALLGAGALGSLVGCDPEAKVLGGVADLPKTARDRGPGERPGNDAISGLPDAGPARIDQKVAGSTDGPHRSVRLAPAKAKPPIELAPDAKPGAADLGGPKPSDFRDLQGLPKPDSARLDLVQQDKHR